MAWTRRTVSCAEVGMANYEAGGCTSSVVGMEQDCNRAGQGWRGSEDIHRRRRSDRDPGNFEMYVCSEYGEDAYSGR